MQIDTEKENYVALQKAINVVKKDFSFEDAINCWHKQRKFKFRTEQQNIIIRKNDDVVCKRFNAFVPLWSSETKRQTLLKSGFYALPIDYKLDWHQNKLYENIFNDFLNLFVIDGDNPIGYYFHGNIGVGKTTLLTAIAKVLKTFLVIDVRYITMTRLVRLITSIDKEDKNKIEKLENCCVLFIDDLGIEKYATDTQEAFVRDFFAYRYGKNKYYCRQYRH